MPGDITLSILGEDATQEEIVRLQSVFGLDKPIHYQYLAFISALVRGDLGQSMIKRRAVSNLIIEKLPATLELTITALIIALVFSIPIGAYSATHSGSHVDQLVRILALAGVSMPAFLLAIVLILLFSLELRWLPSFGRGEELFVSVQLLFSGNSSAFLDSLRHLVLPATVLAAAPLAMMTRLLRSGMLDVLCSNYITTARAKGLAERFVVYKHALRNALIPVITVLGMQLGLLLGGAFIVESVFAWPGLGRLTIGAIFARDYLLIQGCVIVVAVGLSLSNLLVDLAYTVIDPRIEYK